MCEQCAAGCQFWAPVVPGFDLVRATAQGSEMAAGDWGLVESNDPIIVWDKPLTPIPAEDDESPGAEKAFEAALAEADEWPLQVKGDWAVILRLGEAAAAAGYRPGEDGRLEYWLQDRIARLMAAPAQEPQNPTSESLSEGLPIPRLELSWEPRGPFGDEWSRYRTYLRLVTVPVVGKPHGKVLGVNEVAAGFGTRAPAPWEVTDGSIMRLPHRLGVDAHHLAAHLGVPLYGITPPTARGPVRLDGDPDYQEHAAVGAAKRRSP